MHFQLGPTRRDDPVRPTRGKRLGAPTPRSEIRGHQLRGRPYRRFDTLRSSRPAQPYFCRTLALCFLWLTTHRACRPARSALRIADPGPRGAEEHGRFPRPWPVELPAERPQVDLSQNTHGLRCYMPPPSCPSTPAASPPAAGHHSPWRLSPSCRASLCVRVCVRVYARDDCCPPPSPVPPLEPDGLAAWLRSRLRLGNSCCGLLCDRPSRRLRLVCASADPARLVKSLSLSLSLSPSQPLALLRSALALLLCVASFHQVASAVSPLVSSCSQKLAHQQEICSQCRWRGEGGPLLLLTPVQSFPRISIASFVGCPLRTQF